MRGRSGGALPRVWAAIASNRDCGVCGLSSPGSNEVLKRSSQDIKSSMCFNTVTIGFLSTCISGHFPVLVVFHDESDASVQADPRLCQALTLLHPDFLIADLDHALPPERAWVTGRRPVALPAGDTRGVVGVRLRGGPSLVCCRSRVRQAIERFKFSQELACKARLGGPPGLLHLLARYRCAAGRVSPGAGYLLVLSGWFPS